MPSEEKVIKLSQARTLYNDLRGRIENAVTNQIATVEETMEIINEYNNSIKEDDEGMVFNANFVASATWDQGGSSPGFMTEDSVEDIIEAYTSGKNVVIKFIMNEEINNISGYYPPHQGGYMTITGYQNAYLDNEDMHEAILQYDDSDLESFWLSGTHILDNGKLFFSVSTD